MPSTINSQTPWRPFRMIGIPVLFAFALGYLVASGAFSGEAATNTPALCTPPASSTPQR